jgi:hypothetical protein
MPDEKLDASIVSSFVLKETLKFFTILPEESNMETGIVIDVLTGDMRIIRREMRFDFRFIRERRETAKTFTEGLTRFSS